MNSNDLDEMCADSGITLLMLARVYSYLKLGIDPMNPLAAPAVVSDSESYGATLEERIEAPLYLLRSYEKQLANWFLLAGYDVNYERWGN